MDIIRKSPPAVVLSDWNMPEMSGIQLLQAMREEGHKVKLGFVTSETADDMRSPASEQGAAFMITKPFTEDTFRHVLEPLLG